MIHYIFGDIFKSSADVITNPVNCMGAMGAGLALEFRNRYPGMYEDYKKRIKLKYVKMGQPYLYMDSNVKVLNFPTKIHWAEKSKLIYIEEGLKYLAANYKSMKINSIALPLLGCGLGGLNPLKVEALIEKYLGSLEDLQVFVYKSKVNMIGENYGRKAKPEERKKRSRIIFGQRNFIFSAKGELQ